MSMVATCARGASCFGARTPFATPSMIPASTAQRNARTAQSETSPTSVKPPRDARSAQLTQAAQMGAPLASTRKSLYSVPLPPRVTLPMSAGSVTTWEAVMAPPS